MLAACKAAFSGRSQPNGPPSPSDKQVEAFVRALSDQQFDQVAAFVAESRSLLVSPLKCHPARSTAWHLAAESRGSATASGAESAGSGSSACALLELLLQLHEAHGLPREGLPDLINATNKRGQTCLHVAAARGNAPAVRLLLSLGCCELLRADKTGRNALHLAAAAASDECARVLITEAEMEDCRAAAAAAEAAAAGAAGDQNVAQGGAEAGTPAAEAAATGPSSRDGAKREREREQSPPALGSVVGRLVNAPDVSGLTPLHFAAASNCLPLVRCLLAAGGSYTVQAAADNFEAAMPCNAGWTCLHVAAMRGHYDVAMLVLRHHSSRSAEQQVADWRPGRSSRTSDPRAIQDRRGTTAAGVAAARSFPDLAALLNPDTPLAQSVQGAAPLGPDGQELRPPAMYVCPITQEVMRDPVVASDGFSYERAAISRWMSAGKLTSPMTNLPFTSRTLYPNNVIKSAIKEWRQQHRLPDPDAPQQHRGGASGRRGVVMGAAAGQQRSNATGGGAAGTDPFLSHLRAHGL